MPKKMSKIAQNSSFPLAQDSIGHLICTFISENQGLEKLRSVSNLIKISVPVHLNFFFSAPEFFFSLSPEFFSGLWYKSEKNPVDKLKKIQVY